jgi:hypothetical protein
MRGRSEASRWVSTGDLRILDSLETNLEFRRSGGAPVSRRGKPESIVLLNANINMDSGFCPQTARTAPE